LGAMVNSARPHEERLEFEAVLLKLMNELYDIYFSILLHWCIIACSPFPSIMQQYQYTSWWHQFTFNLLKCSLKCFKYPKIYIHSMFLLHISTTYFRQHTFLRNPFYCTHCQ
jgi:hypothetical protein